MCLCEREQEGTQLHYEISLLRFSRLLFADKLRREIILALKPVQQVTISGNALYFVLYTCLNKAFIVNRYFNATRYFRLLLYLSFHHHNTTQNYIYLVNFKQSHYRKIISLLNFFIHNIKF